MSNSFLGFTRCCLAYFHCPCSLCFCWRRVSLMPTVSQILCDCQRLRPPPRNPPPPPRNPPPPRSNPPPLPDSPKLRSGSLPLLRKPLPKLRSPPPQDDADERCSPMLRSSCWDSIDRAFSLLALLHPPLLLCCSQPLPVFL